MRIKKQGFRRAKKLSFLWISFEDVKIYAKAANLSFSKRAVSSQLAVVLVIAIADWSMAENEGWFL